MDFEKFYKTTTKRELFLMVLELSEIADITGDPVRMMKTSRKLIRRQIDSEEFWQIVNENK
jgi:hypothetical protein